MLVKLRKNTVDFLFEWIYDFNPFKNFKLNSICNFEIEIEKDYYRFDLGFDSHLLKDFPLLIIRRIASSLNLKNRKRSLLEITPLVKELDYNLLFQIDTYKFEIIKLLRIGLELNLNFKLINFTDSKNICIVSNYILDQNLIEIIDHIVSYFSNTHNIASKPLKRNLLKFKPIVNKIYSQKILDFQKMFKLLENEQIFLSQKENFVIVPSYLHDISFTTILDILNTLLWREINLKVENNNKDNIIGYRSKYKLRNWKDVIQFWISRNYVNIHHNPIDIEGDIKLGQRNLFLNLKYRFQTVNEKSFYYVENLKKRWLVLLIKPTDIWNLAFYAYVKSDIIDFVNFYCWSQKINFCSNKIFNNEILIGYITFEKSRAYIFIDLDMNTIKPKIKSILNYKIDKKTILTFPKKRLPKIINGKIESLELFNKIWKLVLVEDENY